MASRILPYVPQSASSISVEVQRLSDNPAMRRMAPHGHVFFELIVITSGNGRHTVDGLDHEAAPGTVFILPPGSIHDLRGLANADGWAILFQADSVDLNRSHGLAPMDDLPAGMMFDLFRLPVLHTRQSLRLNNRSLAQATGLIERMHDELNARQEEYAQAVRAALQLLLVTLVRCAPWFEASPMNGAQKKNLVSAVFADIDQNFRNAPLLQQASSRLGLSSGYLTTKLRQLTGRTYGEWVIERRMIEARRLLTATNMNLGEISQDLGYAEIESFIRRFRAHHGLSPVAWKQRARNPQLAQEQSRTVKTQTETY